MARQPALPLALLLFYLRAEAEAAARGPAGPTRRGKVRGDPAGGGDTDGDPPRARPDAGMGGVTPEKVFWVPNRAFAPARLPVIMGIQNGSRCLASAPGPRPSLCLQDADIRELPRAGPASAAFTFFRSYRAGLWRFESAANPGWFLCTSARGHQPLGLSRSHDATTRLDFYFSAGAGLCPRRL
uniref:Interleukin-1 n=1 Tax=Strigops habroptila TaxID=2489341 RepID=A0A672U2V4_STRHB